MENLLHNLKALLQKDERLTSEGELLKNKIIELALKLDKDIIKLLLSDKEMKEVFFVNVDKTLIFDKDKFIRFVSNKQFLPDSYTAFKNKIGLTFDDEFLSEKREVVLSWPYKDCVLEGGMTKEDKKRNEIFWNETIAPDEISRLLDQKVFTHAKRIDKKGEHKLDKFKTDENGNIKDNLIIKGNNPLALHSLKNRFAGKVKLIYIDPPYNTGGAKETFTYNNSFNHSTWLTFMKNRLEVAKDFLKKEGFIAIAIDHYELLYLGALADEIFGRENRLGIISILHNPEGRQNARYFTATNEYLLIYSRSDLSEFNSVFLQENFKDSKDITKIYNKRDERGIYKKESFIRLGGGDACLRINKPKGFYSIYVSPDLKKLTLNKKNSYFEVLPVTDSGQERTWKLIPEGFLQKLNAGDIYAKKESGKVKIFEKYRIEKGSPITTTWINKKYNAKKYGTNLLESLLGKKLFSYPKSLHAVLDTLKIMTNKNDIIMDFFAGSGTTGHAVLELNKEDNGSRKFILVEQLDPHIDVCKERISKIIKKDNISDDFVYLELMKWNENFVEKIQKAKTKPAFAKATAGREELKKLWETMRNNAFLSYKVDIKGVDEHAKDFVDLSIEDQKRFLLECLDKNHLYVNYSEIDDEDYVVSEKDKRLNKEFYKI